MYQIPLRYIKVSETVAICATRIAAMMDYSMSAAEKMVCDERKSGKLINACGRLAAKTVIILDNGAVIASPMSIHGLMRAIEHANTKALMPKKGRDLKRLSIYDVADQENQGEPDIDVAEMSTDLSLGEIEDDS